MVDDDDDGTLRGGREGRISYRSMMTKNHGRPSQGWSEWAQPRGNLCMRDVRYNKQKPGQQLRVRELSERRESSARLE